MLSGDYSDSDFYKKGIVDSLAYSGLGLTYDSTWQEINTVLSGLYPQFKYYLYGGTTHITPRISGSNPSVSVSNGILKASWSAYDGASAAYFDEPIDVKGGDKLYVTYSTANFHPVSSAKFKLLVSSTNSHSGNIASKSFNSYSSGTYEYQFTTASTVYLAFSFAYSNGSI